MLAASLKKNDRLANWLIGIFSVVVFAVIVVLGRVKLDVDLGFNVHIFAALNAVVNSIVALLLIAAIIAVRQKKYLLHKQMMMTALILSIVFLVSYIAHHLFAGDTIFGDVDHNGILSTDEKIAIANLRIVYYIILIVHIFLAAIILPFILFTAYRALTAEFPQHKKLAKITWPLWLYVAVTGPIIYWLISPYYQ